MIANATSLSRNGLRDWLIQRVTAVYVAIYTIFMLVVWLTHPNMSFAEWHALMSDMWMRVFTVLLLLALIFHSWIGIWTITTDYIKCVCIRVVVQVAVITALFGYLIWGIAILWGGK